MKKINIRITAIIMIAAVTTAFIAGCKKDSGGLYDLPEFAFTAETVAFPDGYENINFLNYANDKLYFVSYKYEQGSEQEFYAYKSLSEIYTMNLDGSGAEKLPAYVPPAVIPAGSSGNMNVNSMRADKDGNLWIVEAWDIIQISETGEYDYENRVYGNAIRKLDLTGNELFKLDITAIEAGQEYLYISAFNTDDAGNVYIAVNNYEKGGMVIYVYDSTGALLFQLDTESWFYQFIRLSSGAIAFLADSYDESGNYSRQLQTINTAARGFGESIDYPSIGWDAYDGKGGYDLISSDSSNLYGFTIGDEAPVKLLNWIDSDIINNGISNITMIDEERIICTNSTYDRMTGNVRFELLILTRVPYSSLPERTIITLATFQLGEIRDAVVQFNRTSQEYRIRVIDYSEFSTADDWLAGVNRLSTDLITGNVPDILDVTYLQYKEYIARGMLSDMYTFIDNDPDISRGDFVDGAFKAAEVGGGLYQVFSSFSVNSIIGHPSVVGSQMGWNMDEFKAVLDAHPEADMPLGSWLTKTSFLEAAMSYNIDSYIDWGTGTVNFDNSNFVQLLEFCNTFPDEIDWEDMGRDSMWEGDAIPAGRQIMSQVRLYGLSDIMWHKELYGGEIAYKGFPTEDRNGNSLNVNTGLAIIDSSKNKDAAWQFVKTILSKDWQLTYTWGFPTNKEAFDSRIQTAMDDYNNADSGMPMPLITRGGGVISEEAQRAFLTQADADQIIALISVASGTAGWSVDQSIWNIITEEVESYFKGSSSAQDVARNIQSRVAILVSERS